MASSSSRSSCSGGGRALPTLPLRLAAESYGRSIISPSSVALGIHVTPSASHGGNLEVAAIVDDDGIRAFAISAPISRRVLLELLEYPHSSEEEEEEDNGDHQTSSSLSKYSSSSKWIHGPILCLVRTSATSNDMEWHVFAKDEEFPTKISSDVAKVKEYAKSSAFHDAFIAKLLTESIRLYYAQQVLEPSVRGFLSVLEKQFARSDLYLFELLQNAVDDGASEIRLSVQRGSSGGGGGGGGQRDRDQDGLSFAHNGRSFTPLDVLGLSSVGLSTKSREGKRTIGFMGIGFKACYKRYSRVKINDGTYSFAYEKPPQDDNDKTMSASVPGYGWVMQPIWAEGDYGQNRLENSTGADRSKSDAKWCRFSLERPVGGVASVEKDLSILPQTAPPLLGRAALEKRWHGGECNENDSWTLDWNSKVHRINRTRLTPLAGTAALSFQNANDRSEVVQVAITDRSGHTNTSRWLFVSHKYTPSAQAAKSYLSHTKRSHSGQEECCGFIKLGGEEGTTPIFRVSSRTGATLGGIVHSVLPTKLRMPMPMNIQGPWLLSVDRQEVQDLTDNLWNKNLVEHLPMLIINIFRWAASERLSTAAQYGAICKLLPTISGVSSMSSLSTEFLGQSVSLEVLAQAFYVERILPVALPADDKKKEAATAVDTDADKMDVNARAIHAKTGYYEGKNSVWVPPSFLTYLTPDLLRGWLGKRPLRTDLLGDATLHPLFASPKVVGQLDNNVQRRREQLAREIGVGTGQQKHVSDEAMHKLMSVMAAVGAAYSDLPSVQPQDGAGNAKIDKRASPVPATATEKTQAQSISFLPTSIASWPLFLKNDGNLSTLDMVLLPDEDFASVPEKLRSVLRPFMPGNAASGTDNGGWTKWDRSGTKRDFRGKGKQKQKGRGSRSRSPPPPQKQLLHPLLEDAIYALDASGVDSGFAQGTSKKDMATDVRYFVARARSEAPSANIISVASAASNLLTSYSKSPELNAEQVATVMQITEYALRTGNPALISHVVVELPSSGKPSLTPSKEAYIGKALDEDGRGGDLETFSRGSLRFLSSAYITSIMAERQKLLALLESAGVQSGLSATITAIIDVDKFDRELFTSEILPKLPNKKLPQTRKTTTKNTIYIPYDLDVPVDRRKYYLLDSQISHEWEIIVRNMSTSCSIGFISLLLAMCFDSATDVSSKTTPAATAFLSGLGNADSNSNVAGGENVTRGRKTTRLSDTAVPLRRRLCFLPPGQPGGKFIDISESEFIKQLSRWKWIPCVMPSTYNSQGDADSSVVPVLLRPEECLLSPDPSRPDMPIAQLPPLLLKRLGSSEVAKALTWGTRAPPPPLQRLEELVVEVNSLMSSSSIDNTDVSVAGIAREMVSVWTAISRAHLRDNGLGAKDREKIRSICRSESSRCLPVRSSSPSSTGGDMGVVPVTRCILLGSSASKQDESESDRLKALTLESFVASNFVFDYHDVKSNPFFSTPEISRAVVELAGIPSIARVSFAALRKTSASFIKYCCDTEPHIYRFSPLRAAFTFAIKWCMEMPSVLSKKEDGGSGLKIFVKRGPGYGSKALPSRWVSIDSVGQPVQPVLDDDKTRARYSLLSPEMGVQLVGILDHFHGERDCPNASILASIDREAIDYFKVLRLSDKRFIVKTKAQGTAKVINGASLRLQLVFALLKAMDMERVATEESASSSNAGAPPSSEVLARDFLDPVTEAPMIIKYEGLSREFQAPGMDAPVSTRLYAVWGRAPKHISTKRCILVSGEPEDYLVELEQLVLNHVGIRLSAIAGSREYRAALRLLAHLEANSSFNKFVRRDFSDSDVVLRWNKLAVRARAIEKLRKAENEKDVGALHHALMEAEEACENDADGGDSILESARELLPRLEDEARARKEAEDRNRAEEAARLAAVKKEEEAFQRWKEDQKQKALARLASKDKGTQPTNSNDTSSAAPPTCISGGRGRGLTLPSWMTTADTLQPSDGAGGENGVAGSSNGPNKETATNEMEEAKSLVSSIVSETSGAETGKGMGTKSATMSASIGIVSGRGRGVSNAPAWMTKQEEAPSSEPSEQAGAPQVVSTAPGAIAAGRGRGNVSNLPAWMTSTSVSHNQAAVAAAQEKENFVDTDEASGKRGLHEDGEVREGEARPSKKAKLEMKPFEFTLQVQLDPSKLPDFVASVRPQIEEKAKSHGGLAKLERVD